MVNVPFLHIFNLVFLFRIISVTKSSLKESEPKHLNLYEPIVIQQYYQYHFLDAPMFCLNVYIYT